MYKVNDREIKAQQEKFVPIDPGYIEFELSESEIYSLGKKYLNCLLTQDYDERLHDYPIDETNNKVYKYLKDYRRGTKVLLLGVGVGREIICAQELGFDAYGITMGNRNVRFGVDILGIQEERLLEGCMEMLPFVKESFDVVAGFQVFEHAISPMLVLLEQNRVLKFGGDIVFEWPPASFHGTNGKDPQHQVCYVPGQVEGLLLKSGFDSIKMYYNNKDKIPKDNYWKGERDRGYLVAIAKKFKSDKEYIKKATNF